MNKSAAVFLYEIKEEINKEIGVKIHDGFGMQEIIQNICFFDLLLKDSIGFIHIVSELLIFKEMAPQSKNDFTQNLDCEKEEFQAFKAEFNNKELNFTIMMIQDKTKKRKNYLNNFEFTTKFI